MAKNTMTCDCCGGSLPSDVWEELRGEAGECTGSIGKNGRCRAFDSDAWAIQEIAQMLNGPGTMFSGNAAEQARNWLDCEFSPSEVDEWCKIGVWDAAIAAEFRDADMTPRGVMSAAESLDDPAGSTIYAICNGDIAADVIIEAAE